MALSLERWLEIADSKKRLEKYSEKFKIIWVLFYIALVWLVALIFPLTLVLSLKEEVTINGSFKCDTNWENQQVLIFFLFIIHLNLLNNFILKVTIIFHH